MSPLEYFKIVTEKGSYLIGYLVDGWTKEICLEVGSPSEAMMITQNMMGDIINVTYVERKL